MAKYGGIAAFGAAAAGIIAVVGSGGWIVPVGLAILWEKRNWKEQNAAIKDADVRREQILRP
jgi:hypothetical protein